MQEIVSEIRQGWNDLFSGIGQYMGCTSWILSFFATFSRSNKNSKDGGIYDRKSFYNRMRNRIMRRLSDRIMKKDDDF